MITLSSSATSKGVKVRGALLEGAVSTTKSNVALASVMLGRIPGSVVDLSSIGSKAVGGNAGSVSRAAVGAAGTSAGLSLVSREAVALTSGSIAETLTSTFQEAVGSVGIPVIVVSSGGAVYNGRAGGSIHIGFVLKRLKVNSSCSSSQCWEGLIGRDGNSIRSGSCNSNRTYCSKDIIRSRCIDYSYFGSSCKIFIRRDICGK